MFDVDRSGAIDREEFKRLCDYVGHDVNEAEIDEMMSLADEDGSGSIDFWEFATIMARKMGGSANTEKLLEAAFHVFDQDGDGTISANELKAVMKEMGEPVHPGDIDRVIGAIDLDGDGVIDLSEFSQVVTKAMRDGGYTLG